MSAIVTGRYEDTFMLGKHRACVARAHYIMWRTKLRNLSCEDKVKLVDALNVKSGWNCILCGQEHVVGLV